MAQDLDLEWKTFLENDEIPDINNDNINYDKLCSVSTDDISRDKPLSTPIYISTKTKISYLNQKINLAELFWKIKIINYEEPKEGIVKKQMKFNSLSQEELDKNLLNIKETDVVENHIMTHIVNPEGRIKFKDVRKISIGLSNKDIISCRRKKRGAFYNCFVVILRIKENNKFREVHVKVFNTGKLEIPGVQNAEMLETSLAQLVKELAPIIESDKELSYLHNKSETVLINSNFNCGYFINRDKLYNTLRYNYKLNCGYDPCSYPGIQCEFYYNEKLGKQTGIQPSVDEKENIIKISFMIFRTGSVLIVGKCSEEILIEIYEFLKTLLENEYTNVCNNIETAEKFPIKIKKAKSTKKKILYTLIK